MTIEKEYLNSIESLENEEAIRKVKEELNEFQNELPITEEEAKDICVALDDYLINFQETDNPSEALRESLNKSINDAKSAWVLKLSEEESLRANWIAEKIVSAGFGTNLLIRGDKPGKVYISPNGLIETINSLDKEDRKLIKKILKAIVKTHEREIKKHINKID